MPSQVELVSWHVEQLLVPPAWIMAAVGAGVINRVPGPVALTALPGINPVGTLAWWQLSQLVEVGR